MTNKSRIIKSAYTSIAWCFLLLIIYVAYETKVLISTKNPFAFLGFLPIFSFFYLLISIIGWLVVGLPYHWFLSNYNYKSYFLYAFLPLMFIVGNIVFKGNELGFVCGVFALVQALIFRYYVYKRI